MEPPSHTAHTPGGDSATSWTEPTRGSPLPPLCPENGTRTWYATVFHMCPEVLRLVNIKRKCFQPNTYQCLCAYTAKQLFQQASYTPKHKKAKAEDTAAFLQASAATLKVYKHKAKGTNQGASSLTIEED
eukprot:3106142-Pleurochrysis_carterae.AAC.1